ncbi:MAG TPA: universal stress protein [Ktedonobacterales bacterium]
MSSVDDSGRQQGSHEADAPFPHDPMSSVEAERAREDALRRANERWAAPMISGAHGRVEEETRLLTEQLTREEQARRRAAHQVSGSSEHPTVELAAVTRVAGRRIPVGEPMKRIVLALDGSLYAERALPYAEALGRMVGADLVIGYSTDRADLASRDVTDVVRTGGNGSVVSALLRARARVAAAGLRASTRIVFSPSPAEGILALARDLDATVIALASHARHGAERTHAGTMVDETLCRHRAYTLVVPSAAPNLLDKRCAFRRILAPLDGSQSAESALALLGILLTQPAPEERPRRVTLLFVAESHAQEADGAAYLHEIQAAIERETGVHGVVFTSVAVGAPSAAISGEASGARSPIPSVARYDLTLLATRVEAVSVHWALGGVAIHALAHGDTPTLFVRGA